jgi:hypothetical protein
LNKVYRHWWQWFLIYAQRPDATACASIEIWNEKMHCWVNRGAKGRMTGRTPEMQKLTRKAMR